MFRDRWLIALCAFLFLVGTAFIPVGDQAESFATYSLLALLTFGLWLPGGSDMGFVFLILAPLGMGWADSLLIAGTAIFLLAVVKRVAPPPTHLLHSLISTTSAALITQGVFHAPFVRDLETAPRLLIASIACFTLYSARGWKKCSINSTTVGASTPSTGAFTSLSANSGITLTGGALAINTASGITSNQTTLIINAGGNVDIQDALNVDNLTTDTGGVSIAAGQSYTGAGTVTLASAAGSNVTIDSGTNGTIGIGTDASSETIQIGSGAASKTIQIGNGNQGNTIQIGTNNTNADSIQIGSALDTTTLNGAVTANGLSSNGITITGGSINGTTIGGSTPSTGAFTTLSSSGATNLGTAGASAVNIATTGTGSTTIGNSTGNFSLTSNGGLNVTTGGALTGVASIDTIGTSATALTFAGAGTVSSTGANALTLDSGTTGAINLGTGTSGKTIHIGDGVAANTITIGNASDDTTTINGNGSSAITFSNFSVSTAGLVTVAAGQSYTGSGAVSLTSGAGGALTVDSNAGGQVNLGTGNTSKTIKLGTGTGGNTIQIGTDNTSADTIQIGSALDSIALAGATVTSNGSAVCTSANGLCVTATPSLNQTYNSSTSTTEINENSTQGALTLADTIGGTGQNLFEIQNANNSVARYFAVNATSTTVTGIFNINNATGIVSNQSTLAINAGGNVDVQDTLNADGITTDTSGVSIAASQSYTGAGAVTLSSAVASNLTIDSGTTGTIGIGTDASAEIIAVGSGAAVKTIRIGNGTAGNTIQIGTDNSNADTITIGSALDSIALAGASVTANGSGVCTAANGLCVTSATMLQTYNSSTSTTEINENGTQGALTLADTIGGTGQNLFEIQNANNSIARYFAVNATSTTVTGIFNINNATGIASNQSTLVVNAGGNVDVQDALNADNITTDTGGVSVAANQAYTGAGAITLSSAVASNLTIDSGTTGTIGIGTDTSAESITIGSGNTGVKTIQIGLGNAGNTIQIGTNNTVADTITIGSALDTVAIAGSVTANTFASSGVTITGGSINNTTIGAGTPSTGAFTTLSANNGITLTGGALAINTASGITSNQSTLTINAGGNVDVQDILNVDNLTTDTGGVSVAAGQSYTGAGAVTLSSAAGTNLTVDSGTTGAVNIGTSANAKTITIGNTTSSTALNLDTGTGGINIGDNANSKTTDIGGNDAGGTDTVRIATNATGADAITIGSTNASSTLTLEGGTAGSAIQIGNSSNAHGIQIGTGAAVQTIIIGSTNGASATTIQAGSTGISLAAATTITGSGSARFVCTDCVDLSSETVGNYLTSISSSGTSGITTTGGTGKGATPTIALNVQANKGLEVDGNGLSMIDCANGQVLAYNTGTSSWACASGSATSLQGAYDTGPSITTTDGRNITFVLADTTTDSNFNITTATGATGFTTIARADGAGTADPNELLLIRNNDVDRVLPVGLRIDAVDANGKMTTGIDLTSSNLVTAIDASGNLIKASTLNSAAAAALTVDSGTTGTLNLGTGNNAKTINIGTGTAGDAINIGTNNSVADTIVIGSALDTVTLAGSVTANTFASSGVTITGGSINNTTIGAGTPSTGAFTTLAANNGITLTGGALAINTASGVTSNQATLIINAGGNVDIQDTLNIDNLTTDTGGVSIAASQSYTGAGAVTLSSAAASNVTIDSGTTGTIGIGTDASAEIIQVGSGAAVKTIRIGNGTSGNTIEVGFDNTNADTIRIGTALDSIALAAATATLNGSSLCTAGNGVCLGAGSNNLNQAYNAATSTTELSTNATQGALTVADTFNGAANVFEIQNRNAVDAYTSRYFTVSSTSTTVTGIFNINNATGIASNQSTLVINASGAGTVDVQDTLNADNITTDTGGVSVAANQAYTGAGAVTLSSAAGTNLTIDSGTTGTIGIGTDTSAETIALGSGNTGVKTIQIGLGNAGNTIQIGTNNTNADTITIGSALDTVSLAGSVTANTFASSGVTITGGSINNTTIGAGTASSGAFTTLTSTGVTTLGNNSATVAVNSSDWDINATGDATGIGGITMDGILAVNNATGITSNQATLTINAGGNVDIQDALNVDSLSTDTGGVSIAASQSYTGAGAIGITSGANGNITITPNGTGDVVFNIDGDTNHQIIATAAPAVDMFVLTNAGQGISTNAVYGLNQTFVTAGTTNNADNAAHKISVTSGNNGTTTTLEAIDIANLSGAQGNATETALRIGTGWDVGVSVASGGVTITAGALAINNATGITSNQTTLNVNAGGNVDIQDALNADNITTDTGGVSIAASQSYTGAGAVTLSSAAATNLTIDSGTTGTIGIGTDASAEVIQIGSGAAAKTIRIGNGTSGNTIELGFDNTNADTIRIGSALDFIALAATTATLNGSGICSAGNGLCSSVTNLQQAYNAATSTTELGINATQGALTVADTFNGAANIFEIQNRNAADAYTTRYFTISSTSTTITNTLIANGAVTLGNNSATVAINSSDWDIDATGVVTGLASIAGDDNQAALNTNINVTGADAGSHTIALQIDGNNGLSIAATGNGAGSVGARAITIGLGGDTVTMNGSVTANTLASSGVTITGGSINTTTIGAGTPSTGAFTTLSANNGITLTGGALAINTASGITSNQGTLIINAGGAVDIQDALTADSLTTDVGGVSIAASQSYTGAGAVTLSSAAASNVTIDSGTTGTIGIGTDASAEIIQVGSGAAVKTIRIGNGASGNTIEVGFDNTVADTIRIGSALDSIALAATTATLNGSGLCTAGNGLCVSSTNLMQAYNAATSTTELGINATQGALTIADTFNGAENVFEIQNRNGVNAYTNRYFTVSSTSTIVTGIFNINNATGIASNQATLNINAGGNVDVQDTLNADNITTDTGGVSVAANQAYTGAGAVTLSSAAGTNLTIDSGTNGTIGIGTDASAEQIQIGSGAAVKTIQIGNGANGNTIQLGTNNSVADTIQIGSALDTVTIAGSVTANTLASSGVTITGGSINNTTIGAGTPSTGAFTTLSANNGITLTGGALAVNTASGITSNQGTLIINAGGAVDVQDALTADSLTTDVGGVSIAANQAYTGAGAVTLSSAAGTNVTIDSGTNGTIGIGTDASAEQIQIGSGAAVKTIQIGNGANGNTIQLGTNNSVADTIQIGSALDTVTIAGSVTANTFASSGVTITGGSINNTSIGLSTPSTGAFTTLSSTGATTLGNNSATVAINSSDWDITAIGDMTGIGGLTMDGNFSQTVTSNSATAFSVKSTGGEATLLNIDTVPNATNLITNPSVETTVSPWAQKGTGNTAPARSTAQAYVGSASIFVDTTTSPDPGDGVQYAFTFSAATTYTFSFYAKLDVTSNTFFTTANLNQFAAGYNISADVNCALSPSQNNSPLQTGSWTRYSCTFTPGAGSGTVFIKQLDSVIHKYYIDAAQLEVGTVPSVYRDGRINIGGSQLTIQNLNACDNLRSDVNGNVLCGSDLVNHINVVEGSGHSIMRAITQQNSGSTSPDYRWMQRLAQMLHAQELNHAVDSARTYETPLNNSYPTGSSYLGVFQQIIPPKNAAGAIVAASLGAPYFGRNGLGAIQFGINDIASLKAAGGATNANMVDFTEGLRTIIGRYQASALFEDNAVNGNCTTAASCVSYTTAGGGAAWSSQPETRFNSGTTLEKLAGGGGAGTGTMDICLPLDLNSTGGVVQLGFLADSAATTGGTHTILLDGVTVLPIGSTVTHDTRPGQADGVTTTNTANSSQRVLVTETRRIRVPQGNASGTTGCLAAGTQHKITVNFTNINLQDFFDFWAIEPTQPTPTIVMNIPKGISYPYGGSFINPVDADIDLTNGIINSVAAEFSPGVMVVDLDKAMGKNPNAFANGGNDVHPNDLGHQIMAQTAYKTIASSTVPTVQSTAGLVGPGFYNFSTKYFNVIDNNAQPTFTIDTTVAAPGGTPNMVLNPSFEIDTQNWLNNTGSAMTIAQNTTTRYTGNNSLKIVTTAAADDGARYVVDLAANTTYTLSFYAKATTSSVTNLRVGYINTTPVSVPATCAAGGLQSNGSLDTTAVSTGWKRFNCTFTTAVSPAPLAASGNGGIYIGISTAAISDFSIDGVLLQQTAALNAYDEAGSINLIGDVSGPVQFVNNSDSQTAFQVLNAVGSNVIVNVDTVSNAVNLLNSAVNFKMTGTGGASSNFGALATAGAFLSRNTYFGEEFNISPLNATQTCLANATLTNAGWARGDAGSHNNAAVTCGTSLNQFSGGFNWSTKNGAATAGQGCTVAYQAGVVNGAERLSAASTATAANAASCTEALAATQATSNKIFAVANLPVASFKVKASTLTAAQNTDRVRVGLSNVDTATAMGAPTNGLFFSNCSTESVTTGSVAGCSNTTWYGHSFSASAEVAGGPLTCSVGAGAITTNFAYLRIEVRSATDIHFYADYNTADGIVESECGTGITGTSTAAALTTWFHSTVATNAARTAAIDVDYIRVWQDDAAIASASGTPSTVPIEPPLVVDQTSAATPFNARAILAGFMVQTDPDVADANTEAAIQQTDTGRLLASVEIVTPKITAHTLAIDGIQPASGNDIGLAIPEGGVFKLIGVPAIDPNAPSSRELPVGTTVISFDNHGNGNFAGSITADTINAQHITGLDALAGQLATLSNSLATSSASSTDYASQSALQSLQDLLAALTSNANGLTVRADGLSAQLAVLAALQDSASGTLAFTTNTLADQTTILGDLTSRLTTLETQPGIDLGDLVLGGLTVNGLATFHGGLNVNTIAALQDLLTIMSDTNFIGRPYFNADTGGFALIAKNATSTQIVFTKEYSDQPVVNASISLENTDDPTVLAAQEQAIFTNGVQYLITNKTKTGFRIILNKPAPENIRFSWIALAVKDAQTIESVPTDVLPTPPVTPPPSSPPPDPIPPPTDSGSSTPPDSTPPSGGGGDDETVTPPPGDDSSPPAPDQSGTTTPGEESGE